MYKNVTVISAAIMLGGCVSFSTDMVNANGAQEKCHASGGGFGLGAIVGATSAAIVESSCVSHHEEHGYLDIDEAGALGVKVVQSEEGDFLVVKSIIQEIAEGDRILEINGQVPSNLVEFKQASFGKLEDEIGVTCIREETETKMILPRSSFNEVFQL